MVKGDGETVIGTKVNMTSFTDPMRIDPGIQAFRTNVAQVRGAKMMSEAPTQAAAFATVVGVSSPPPPPAPVYVQQPAADFEVNVNNGLV